LRRHLEHMGSSAFSKKIYGKDHANEKEESETNSCEEEGSSDEHFEKEGEKRPPSVRIKLPAINVDATHSNSDEQSGGDGVTNAKKSDDLELGEQYQVNEADVILPSLEDGMALDEDRE